MIHYSLFSDFKGPEAINAYIGNGTFINCYIPTDADYSIIWNINGTYYNPTELPSNYVLKPDGLKILRVSESLNETTYQCLIESDDLLGEAFFFSGIGKITVLPNEGMDGPI